MYLCNTKNLYVVHVFAVSQSSQLDDEKLFFCSLFLDVMYYFSMFFIIISVWMIYAQRSSYPKYVFLSVVINKYIF